MKFSVIQQILKDAFKGIKQSYFASNRTKFGYIDKTAIVFQPGYGIKENVFLHKNTVVHEYYKFISPRGKFIMKENSIAAAGLTVITCNHPYAKLGSIPGGEDWGDYQIDDVLVEEHVWIGTNVTLCPGTHLNRGIVVAAGSVCIKSAEYPPYSIVGGNPAKFIKYKFTLEQQIKHEKICFPESERLPIELLEKNFNRFTKELK